MQVRAVEKGRRVADKEPAESSEEPTSTDDLVDPDPDHVDPAEPSGEELLAESDTSGATGIGADEREPVSVGATPRGSSTREAAAARTRRADPEGKGAPTRKRDQPEPAKRRTGPVTFVRESVGELRKVVYPTGPQLLKYFVVVLIFVLFVIAYVSLLDLGFGAAMFRIFA